MGLGEMTQNQVNGEPGKSTSRRSIQASEITLMAVDFSRERQRNTVAGHRARGAMPGDKIQSIDPEIDINRGHGTDQIVGEHDYRSQGIPMPTFHFMETLKISLRNIDMRRRQIRRKDRRGKAVEADILREKSV